MHRGDLYLVRKPGQNDPRKQRVFVVVSRQVLIDSTFSTVICAPVYSRHDGLSTQISVGIEEGLKHESSVHCDELVSLPKSMLTRFVSRLRGERLEALDKALARALSLDS
jgi:mRNA interferase MazF